MDIEKPCIIPDKTIIQEEIDFIQTEDKDEDDVLSLLSDDYFKGEQKEDPEDRDDGGYNEALQLAEMFAKDLAISENEQQEKTEAKDSQISELCQNLFDRYISEEKESTKIEVVERPIISNPDEDEKTKADEDSFDDTELNEFFERITLDNMNGKIQENIKFLLDYINDRKKNGPTTGQNDQKEAKKESHKEEKKNEEPSQYLLTSLYPESEERRIARLRLFKKNGPVEKEDLKNEITDASVTPGNYSRGLEDLVGEKTDEKSPEKAEEKSEKPKAKRDPYQAIMDRYYEQVLEEQGGFFN